MAASALPRPGTQLGPCGTDCKHIDCAQTKLMAQSVCRFCAKIIGYGARFYEDPEKLKSYVHARCLDERSAQ